MDIIVYPRADDENVTITNRFIDSERGTYNQNHDNIVELILIVETRSKLDTQWVVNIDRCVDGISLLIEPKRRNWHMYSYEYTNDHCQEDGQNPKRLEYLELATQNKYKGASHFYTWPPVWGENSRICTTFRKKASRLFNRFCEEHNLVQSNFNPGCFLRVTHQLNDRMLISTDLYPLDTDFHPYSRVTRPYQFI